MFSLYFLPSDHLSECTREYLPFFLVYLMSCSLLYLAATLHIHTTQPRPLQGGDLRLAMSCPKNKISFCLVAQSQTFDGSTKSGPLCSLSWPRIGDLNRKRHYLMWSTAICVVCRWHLEVGKSCFYATQTLWHTEHLSTLSPHHW